MNKPNTWWWIERLNDSSKYNNKQNLSSERISCYQKISTWSIHKAFHNGHNAKFWPCLRGDDRSDKIWRKQHFLTHCCYYLQTQNISLKIATIVVGVWTIIADRIATNCVWDCNNCVFLWQLWSHHGPKTKMAREQKRPSDTISGAGFTEVYLLHLIKVQLWKISRNPSYEAYNNYYIPLVQMVRHYCTSSSNSRPFSAKF